MYYKKSQWSNNDYYINYGVLLKNLHNDLNNPYIADCDITVRFYYETNGESNGKANDRKAVLDYIRRYGYDDMPEGYIVHHDYKNGRIQLVKDNIHMEFTHYGGVHETSKNKG